MWGVRRKKTGIWWLPVFVGMILFPMNTWATSEQAYSGEYMGYVEVPYETNSIYEDGKVPAVYSQEIPESYDAREHSQVLDVGNQNPWGNCWSYTATTTLEGSMLSQNPKFDTNLSEYHLSYYCYKSVVDPLGGTEGDSVRGNGTFERFLDGGGNVLVGYYALANWMGAVDEELTGKVPANPPELADTIESAYLNNVVHLQQMYRLNKEDVMDVKKAIMQQGAVTAAFYYSASYLNKDTAAYYCKRELSSNHGVTIVGWDDNYSKENFLTSPENDGAWLIKNSWGTSFGDNGYFWISYEDASLNDTICVLVGEAADNYEHNYQYDGSYLSSYISASDKMTAANIFRVPDKDTKEALKAVSFELASVNVDYSIQVYKDPVDLGNPESGTPAFDEPVKGTTTYQGYYTVALPKEVLLNPGESFAIVILFEKDNNPIKVSVEKGGSWNNITFVASAKENQSLYRVGENRDWTDLGAASDKNIRIKAFTNNTDIQGDVRVTGIKVEPEAVELKVGEAVELSTEISPKNADNQAVSWRVEDDSIAEVDENGKVTALKRGTTSVYCITQDGGYQAETRVEVYNNLALSVSEAELTVGEALQLNVLLNGVEQDIEENSRYTWEVSGESIAEVSNIGMLQGIGKGVCEIHCFGIEDSREKASVRIVIRTDFKDIRTTDWSYPYIVRVYEKGIMSGKASDTFGTDELLTRAEFVTLLYNYDGKEQIEYTERFKDVSYGKWFTLPITWAAQNSIIAGYGNGNFGVSDFVTREQFLRMLYLYALSQNMIQSEEVHEKIPDTFVDEGSVSSWAKEAVQWAIGKGLLAGKPLGAGELYIDPQGYITRAEGATMMEKFDGKVHTGEE